MKQSAAHDEKMTTAKLGFWLYLMSDIMIFASLFATYMILRNGTAGGPSGKDIFDLNFVFVETLLLLTSSLACGLAYVASRFGKKQLVVIGLVATLLLGGAFLTMELYEFAKLIAEGDGPGRSAFLSAYFTLVGTHGLHIFVGLLWGIVLLFYIARHGVSSHATRKIGLFTLFWHFLDVVWIFIFSIVYLLGALS